jgi:hypothetical protein
LTPPWFLPLPGRGVLTRLLVRNTAAAPGHLDVLQPGWRSLFRPGHLCSSLIYFLHRFVGEFLLNALIWQRN